jgi:hypothetical protein
MGDARRKLGDSKEARDERLKRTIDQGRNAERLPRAVAGGGIGGDEPVLPGAVAGGGIGGDQRVFPQVVDEQADDLNDCDVDVLARIEMANQGRAREVALREAQAHITARRDALVGSMRSLVGLRPSAINEFTREARRPFVACIDVLYTALESVLTGVFADDAVFNTCFPGIAVGQRAMMRDGFERLLKESLLRKIDITVAPRAIFQILWNNDALRMMVSASGSIIAIIFARDALLFFANSVLSVMTFGFLDLDQLTNLCFWVYNNCTLVNIQNLLIYFSVTPAAAQQFAQGIRRFILEQRQYIIMSVYLLGLNAIQNVNVDIDALMQRINGQAQGPVDVQGDNEVPAAVPQNQQAAAAALNAAAGAAALNAAAGAAIAPLPAAAAPGAQFPAAAAPDAQLPAPAAVAPVALSDILLNAGTDIVTLIRQIFSYAWSKGLRLTKSCLREVLTVYVRRQPVNQGLRFNLVNLTGTVSRWGVGALNRASAELNPAKPNQEVIRLMFASMGVNPIDPNQAEVSIWQFAQSLKNGAIEILETQELDGQLVYLENQVDLPFLRRHFIPEGAMHVNRELMQSACLGMELFIFEYDMKVDHVVEAFGQRRVLQDSLQVQVSISRSRSQNEARFTAELDSLSKRSFSRASTLCRKFATVPDQGLTLIGVAIGDDEPGVPAAVVSRRNLAKSKIPSKRLIMSGIESSIQRANELTLEQKEQIIADLRPIVGDINETGLVEYLIAANPATHPPRDFITSCQAVLNAPLPASVVAAQEAVRGAPRVVRAAVCNGFNRCAASLSNFAAVSSNAVVGTARSGLACVRGIFGGIFGGPAAVPAAIEVVVPQNDRDAANANIAQNIDAVIAEMNPLPRADRNLDVEIGREQGRRGGRSRKRSASKRTRRHKGVAKKQKSKKNKRQSRRKARRSSSRRSRK